MTLQYKNSPSAGDTTERPMIRVSDDTSPPIMLMVNKEAQQNRTRTVSPAAIPSKANYRVKSKKHL